MLKKYLLMVQEINNVSVYDDKPTLFVMNEVVESAREGDYSLLTDLYMASKIKVYEYHKKTDGEDYFVRYSVCTPKKGRDVLKEHVGHIEPTHEGLVKYLVNYHNEVSDNKVSFEEVQNLYEDILSERQ